MKVEIFFLTGCPNAAPARQMLERALAEFGVNTEVRSQVITECGTGAGPGFAGSPTVLVNGRDVEPAAATGVACRIYANGTGVPSREACERAIAQALKEEGERCSEAL